MNCFGVKQVFWVIHVILKGSHAEIIYVMLGSPEKGRHIYD